MLAAPTDTAVVYSFLVSQLRDGECRPTQRTIAAATGLTVRQVQRATHALAREGRLLIDRPGADLAPTPNRYRFAS